MYGVCVCVFCKMWMTFASSCIIDVPFENSQELKKKAKDEYYKTLASVLEAALKR